MNHLETSRSSQTINYESLMQWRRLSVAAVAVAALLALSLSVSLSLSLSRATSLSLPPSLAPCMFVASLHHCIAHTCAWAAALVLPPLLPRSVQRDM